MHKLIFTLFAIASLLSAVAADNGLGALLDELDGTIRRREIYSAATQRAIDSLKHELYFAATPQRRIDLAQLICYRYTTFCTDSAMSYAVRMGEFARRAGNRQKMVEAEIDRTRVLCTMGLLKEASDALDAAGRQLLSHRLHTKYLNCRLTILNAMRGLAVDAEEKEHYAAMSKIYRDSLLADGDFGGVNRTFVLAEEMLYRRQYDRVIEQLRAEYEKLPTYGRNAGIMAYSIALAYRGKNDGMSEKLWFATSSIVDLRNGVREYTSLRRLAALMYDAGDIDRAYSYMKCSMDDAMLCNARLMTLDASSMFLIIDKSYRQKEVERRQQMAMYFTALVVALLLLLYLYLRNRWQRLHLAEAQRSLSDSLGRLRDTNRNLSDSNLIKEEYISLYMEQYADYLAKISSYKARFMILAKKGNVESIARFLEKAFDTEAEQKAFYHNFDATILHLFPDFVEQFNALLVESARVTLRNGETLTPELRIFALIRLGVTDSVKIAHFLQYSTSTIYNYRTKMRNRAAGNRNEFEGKVARLGLSREI
jgi:hypothetical protein